MAGPAVTGLASSPTLFSLSLAPGQRAESRRRSIPRSNLRIRAGTASTSPSMGLPTDAAGRAPLQTYGPPAARSPCGTRVCAWYKCVSSSFWPSCGRGSGAALACSAVCRCALPVLLLSSGLSEWVLDLLKAVFGTQRHQSVAPADADAQRSLGRGRSERVLRVCESQWTSAGVGIVSLSAQTQDRITRIHLTAHELNSLV